MAYQGWNRDELLAAGSHTNATPNSDNQPPPSFTPINHKRTPLPSLPHFPIERKLDIKFLYDDEHANGTLAKSANKRKAAPPQGRMISLGSVWEFRDEGDIYNNGMSLDDPAPKKKKKANCAKRSQSMKVPPTTGSWDDNGGGEEPEHPRPASQLTTSPESLKRKIGKAGPTASKTKPRQTPPFKNPIITKPCVTRGKETASEICPPDPIISHNGWRSTQDSIKSTSGVLAETTMEKLAAFRFVPPKDSQSAVVTHAFTQRQNIEVLRSPGNEAREPASSNYDPPSDSLFDDALWAVKMAAHFEGPNTNQTESMGTSSLPLDVAEHTLPDTSAINSYIFSLEANAASSMTSQAEVRRKAELTCGIPQDNYNNKCSDSRALDDLTLSTDRGVGKVPSAKSIHASILPTKTHGILNHPSIADMEIEANNIIEEGHLPAESSPRTRQDHEVSEQPTGGFRYSPLIVLSQSNNILELLPMDRGFSHTRQRLESFVTGVQIERSDINEIEPPSKARWGSDEFDDGLADDDLLAVAFDNIMPQSPTHPLPGVTEKPKVCTRFLLPSTPAARVFETHDDSLPYTILNAENTDSPSLQPLVDSDDDYPMNDEDEEDMLQLSEVGLGGTENYQPPESVQREFHRVQEGEVYDSSLQFSPPKSHGSGSSPHKLTRGEHIDKDRSTQLPFTRNETLFSGEDEDWSFIRSTNDPDAGTQILSNTFIVQAQALPCSQSQQAVSIPTRFNAIVSPSRLPASQLKSNASCPMIDDSHEYEPMKPFARPEFPALILDRSPVVGLSTQAYLRTCFRIGELHKEGVRCAALVQDTIIELFARVIFSSRETGTTKQHFQFADLWHDRAPFPNGILANYKTTGLADTESKVFLRGKGKMARCLGRLKRDVKNGVWVLHVVNIRETDWEEIRWTKQIISHGMLKVEKASAENVQRNGR